MASSNIKGITIKLGADMSDLTSSLTKVNSSLKTTQTQLNQVNNALKFNPSNTELLAQKQELLKSKINDTKTALDNLKEAQARMDANGVEKTSEQYMSVRREIIECESKLKTYNNELAETVAKSSQLGQLGTQFSDMGNKITKMGNEMRALSIAAAAVATAIGACAVSAGVWADNLNTASKVTGINTEQLQIYAAAAELVDVSVETIGKSMTRMKKNMLTASQGTGDAAKAFEALGINVTDSSGKLRDQDTVFQETIKKLGQMKNETERDALAMQIFGKSATELNPLIEDMGETYANAIKYMEEHKIPLADQDTLDQANRFNDAIDTIKMVWSQAVMVIGSQLAGYLAPAMEKVADVLATVAGAVANMNPAILTAIMGIAGVVAAIAPALLIGGKIMTLLGEQFTQLSLMITKLPLLGSAFNAVWGILSANPIMAVIAALIALGAAFVALGGDADAIGEKLSSFVTDVVTKAATIIPEIVTAILNNLPEIINAAIQIVLAIITGLIKAMPELVRQAPQLIKAIVSGLVSALPELASVGVNIVKGLWSGAGSMVDWAVNKFKGLGKSILKGIKNALGIKSPSRVFRDQVGKNIVLGLAQGIEKNQKYIKSAMGTMEGNLQMSAAGLSVGYGQANYIASSSSNDALASNIVTGLVSALSGVTTENNIVLDGKVVAKQITPIINTNLGRTQTLSARGV